MQDQLDHIEEYLNGNLSEDERRDFEARMKSDESLNEKVANHRSLLKGLELGFNRELKSLLQQEEQMQKQISIKKNKQIKLRNYSMGLAAAVALILVSIYSIRNQSLDSNELYFNYYTSYPNVEAPVSRSDDQIDNAYSFYEQGNYPRALKLFSKLNKENPLDPAPIFYSGICNLEIDNAETAITFFDLIQKLDQNKYSKPAIWYEALSNLKLNRKSRTIELLNDLIGDEDSYSLKSKELLSSLGQ